MFTVCPKCSLKLVVTAADLRVAQGFVRCGRCSNVFNALAGLTDEQQAALDRESEQTLVPPQREGGAAPAAAGGLSPSAAPSAAPPRTPPPPRSATPANPAAAPRTGTAAMPGKPPAPAAGAGPPPPRASVPPARAPASPPPRTPPPRPAAPAPGTSAPAPPSAPAPASSAPAPRRSPPAPAPPAAAAPQARDEPPLSDAALEFNPTATDVSTVFIQPDTPAEASRSGTFESIVLSAEDSAALEATDSDTIQFELEEITARLDAAHAAALDATGGAAASPPQSARSPGAAAPSVESAPPGELPADAAPSSVAMELLGELRAERRSSARYLAGALVLALLLGAQLVHHYRTELAGVDALRGPLTSLYGRLGVPLVPHWDIGAYEVHQLGAETPTAGELTVRASVKNTAPRLQPLPLLRVTVQDRFGNAVAARDVPPASYVKSGTRARDYLSAGQRIDAEVAFVDPGQNAVGFEIDACLELTAGRVVCANDPGVR